MNGMPRREQASIRVVLLMLVSFFLGLAVAAFWFHHPASGNMANAVSPAPVPPPVGQPAAPSPSPSAPPPTASPQPQDPAVIAEVKKLVPNFDSLSLADGENILRAAALEQMDAQIKAAQQQLQDGQNSQSAGEQVEQLKDIAARLQAQIAALKSLKSQP